MATLILGTIGRAVGGPIGGIVGTFLGAAVDRAALGGGGRDGPRLGDLAVQSSAYGEALPRLYGRMRVAGNLIWSPGIREIRAAGGGKSGGAATSYSYSASFAVALSARRITGIGRIWADGKLLRDAAGIWLYPATMRLHLGDERQSPDPLIVAAEGIGKAPAYRGIAYVVFDDLPLADYANRIPNLTFEVVADAGETVDIGTVVGDITAGRVRPTGDIQAVHGFAATRAGAVRVGLEPLVDLADLVVVDDGNGLAISAHHATATIAIAADDLGAAPPGRRRSHDRFRRSGARLSIWLAARLPTHARRPCRSAGPTGCVARARCQAAGRSHAGACRRAADHGRSAPAVALCRRAGGHDRDRSRTRVASAQPVAGRHDRRARGRGRVRRRPGGTGR